MFHAGKDNEKLTIEQSLFTLFLRILCFFVSLHAELKVLNKYDESVKR